MGMSPKKIPKGCTQISLVIPNYILNKFDKMCDAEKRKRPGQFEIMVERYAEISVKVGGEGK
jgi:hypothetical protein